MSLIRPYGVRMDEICVDPTAIAFLASGGGVIIKNNKNGRKTISMQPLPTKALAKN